MFYFLLKSFKTETKQSQVSHIGLNFYWCGFYFEKPYKFQCANSEFKQSPTKYRMFHVDFIDMYTNFSWFSFLFYPVLTSIHYSELVSDIGIWVLVHICVCTKMNQKSNKMCRNILGDQSILKTLFSLFSCRNRYMFKSIPNKTVIYERLNS